MGDDIDTPPLGLGLNVLSQLGSPLLNGAAGRNRGCDDLYLLGAERLLDAMPGSLVSSILVHLSGRGG